MIRWWRSRKMRRAVRRANSFLGPLRATRRRGAEERATMIANLRWGADHIERETRELRNNLVRLQLKQRISLN